MDSKQSAGNEIEALNRIGAHDELLKSILRSIPKECVTSGCPTTYELTQRFTQVHSEGWKAAFVPENSMGLLGQVRFSMLLIQRIIPYMHLFILQTTGLILSWLAVPRKGLVSEIPTWLF